MKDYSIFDIIGPIMVGPSSSHTAGAVRLGKTAMELAEKNFYKVVFYLHGSFAKTYKGHGTDKALVAGILGFEPHDERVKNSLEIASHSNLIIEFNEIEFDYAHPNTAKIEFHYSDKPSFFIIGSSIGGGNIVITNINGDDVEFTGKYPTILLKYIDKKGIISQISTILSNNDINIANMKVTRDNNLATFLCETDNLITDKVKEEILKINNYYIARFINPVRG
ncbi:MAG: L-serine ammonia-lyase, iron-sulfur-dependent, subunit beta [Tissierellales bacterium]|nr:L-serine ammonia-lyase, iron-sulfur-dependent, subunit beta [Tissierellales bacterium]